jgi:hypothetical protein
VTIHGLGKVKLIKMMIQMIQEAAVKMIGNLDPRREMHQRKGIEKVIKIVAEIIKK